MHCRRAGRAADTSGRATRLGFCLLEDETLAIVLDSVMESPLEELRCVLRAGVLMRRLTVAHRLAGNHITDAGAAQLAMGLRTNTTLRLLECVWPCGPSLWACWWLNRGWCAQLE